jgi:hypothetical protein
MGFSLEVGEPRRRGIVDSSSLSDLTVGTGCYKQNRLTISMKTRPKRRNVKAGEGEFAYLSSFRAHFLVPVLH